MLFVIVWWMMLADEQKMSTGMGEMLVDIHQETDLCPFLIQITREGGPFTHTIMAPPPTEAATDEVSLA